MTVRTNAVTRSGMIRGFVRLIQMVGLTLACLLAAAAPVSAADDELSADLDGGWGKATVKVTPDSGSVAQTLEIEAWITDTRADSRCVYVEYKVKISRSWDPDRKIVRVCEEGDQDYGIKRQSFHTGSGSPQSVEFKLCREQGFGTDPCVKETVYL